MKYKEIHIWEFPNTRTFIKLDDNFRRRLFLELRGKFTTQEILNIINEKSKLYREKTNFNSGHICAWREGKKKSKNKISSINIPLWILIEFSKIIAENNYNDFLKQIEKNITSYRGLGKAKSIYNPRLPILLTPEMTSIVFHLCGDGHVGIGEGTSHYRQVNKEGLECFIKKLKNIFGDFELTIFEDSKVIIPRIITDFYMAYFKLNTLGWDIARIPNEIKNMENDFLLAGLTSFIIDEGHISSDTIEIYSKNKNLISDIRDVSIKLGYNVIGPKEKFRYGKFDSYRIYISTKSAKKFYNDIEAISKRFPTCKLAHKTKLLGIMIKRQNRPIKKTKDGETKKKILKLLEKSPRTTSQISVAFNIGNSSVREHMEYLKNQNKIQKNRIKGQRSIVFSKIM